jgi:uncharacterized membrane protein YozB (DUF420 family)
MDVQMGVGVLSIAFISSLALALYNIKRLQIEQHRAWMLRAWFYVSGLVQQHPKQILTSQGWLHHYNAVDPRHIGNHHQQ